MAVCVCVCVCVYVATGAKSGKKSYCSKESQNSSHSQGVHDKQAQKERKNALCGLPAQDAELEEEGLMPKFNLRWW